MFNKARIKLTGWYVMIIMFISVAFSGVIYKVLTHEVERFERIQRLRIERKLQAPGYFPLPNQSHPFRLPVANPELIKETKQRILVVLLVINGAILVTSGGLAYFLAGLTLRPIKEMVDEQNRFITDASHQLRTPLTSLKCSLEVYLRDENLTLQDAKTLIGQNIEDVNKLQSLSDGLLQLAQYEKSNNDTIFATVNIAKILDEAVHKTHSLAHKKQIVVKNNAADYTAHGNRYSLIDLFVILLDNAIKYSSEKSIVTIDTRKTNESIVISVEDFGVGISKKDMTHIFDRFYRGEKSRSKSALPGYGLGLAIAKKIVEVHNGSISVESKLNAGTTFIVELLITQPMK